MTITLSKSHIEFLKNMPSNQDYFVESFLGQLHEKSIWNETQFWILDKSLHDLCYEYNGDNLPRDILSPVLKIFSHIMLLISCHYDQNDSYSIHNLQPQDLIQFRDRVRLLFEGFIQGNLKDNKTFQKINTLIT